MNYIVVHHSAVSVKRQAEQFIPINKYHKRKWDFKSELGFYGGYNFLIEADGRVLQYRNIGEETIAQKGHNFDSISICLAGDFDVDLPTYPQERALGKKLSELCERYNIAFVNIVPHRKWSSKSCYGRNLEDNYACHLAMQYKINWLLKLFEIIKGKVVKALSK